MALEEVALEAQVRNETLDIKRGQQEGVSTGGAVRGEVEQRKTKR